MKRSTLRNLVVRSLSLTLGILISLCLGCLPGNRNAWAASDHPKAEPVGEVRQIQEAAGVIRGGEEGSKALSAFDRVYVMDAILTGPNSKLWLNLDKTAADEADASLGADSSLKFFASHIQGASSSLVAGIEHGAVRFIKKLADTNPASAFVVATPTALVRVLPTQEPADFVIEAIDSRRARVTVLWGKVVVKNIADELPRARLLTSCRTVLVEQGREPSPTTGVSKGWLLSLASMTTIPGTLPVAVASCREGVVHEQPIPPVSMPDIPLPPMGLTPPAILAELANIAGQVLANLPFGEGGNQGPAPGNPPPGGAGNPPPGGAGNPPPGGAGNPPPGGAGNPPPGGGTWGVVPPPPPGGGSWGIACGPCDKKNADGTCTKVQIKCLPGWEADYEKCTCKKPNQPNSATHPNCTGNGDCPKDWICNGFQCLPPQCKSNSECPKGYACVQGWCMTAAPKPCKSNGDCPQGFVCEGGQCVKDKVTDAVPKPCKSNGDCPQGFVCSGGKCVKDKVTDAVPQPAKCGPCDKKNSDGTCTKWQPQCDEKNGWHANPTTCLCEKWFKDPPGSFTTGAEGGHMATHMTGCSADNHCPKDMVCLWGKCVSQSAKQSNSTGSQSSSLTDTGKKDDDPGIGSKSYPVKQPGDTPPWGQTVDSYLANLGKQSPAGGTGNKESGGAGDSPLKGQTPDSYLRNYGQQSPAGSAQCGPCDKKNANGTCTKVEIKCSDGWTPDYSPGACACAWRVGEKIVHQNPSCSADSDCPGDWVCKGGICMPPSTKQSKSGENQSPSTKDNDPGIGSKNSPMKQSGDTYVRTLTRIPSLPPMPSANNWDTAPKVSQPATPPMTGPTQPATQQPPDRKPSEDPDAGTKKFPVAAVPGPSVKPEASLAKQVGLSPSKPGGSIEQNPGSSTGKAQKSWEHLVTSKIVPAVVPTQTKPPLKDPDAPYAGSKKPPETAAVKSSAKPDASLAARAGLKTQKAGGSIEQDPGSSSSKAPSAGTSSQTSSSSSGQGYKQLGKINEDVGQKSQRIQGASQTLRGDQPKLFPIQAAPVKVSNPVQQKPVLQSMPVRQVSPARVSNPVQQPAAMKTMPTQVMRRK